MTFQWGAGRPRWVQGQPRGSTSSWIEAPLPPRLFRGNSKKHRPKKNSILSRDDLNQVLATHMNPPSEISTQACDKSQEQSRCIAGWVRSMMATAAGAGGGGINGDNSSSTISSTNQEGPPSSSSPSETVRRLWCLISRSAFCEIGTDGSTDGHVHMPHFAFRIHSRTPERALTSPPDGAPSPPSTDAPRRYAATESAICGGRASTPCLIEKGLMETAPYQIEFDRWNPWLDVSFR